MNRLTASFDRFAEWILGRTDETDRSQLVPALRAFRAVFLVHVVTRAWLWAVPFGPHAQVQVPFALLVSGTCILATRPGWSRRAFLALTGLLSIKFAATFPYTSNHFYLELITIGLLAGLDPDSDDDGALLVQALRWIAILVFFHTGMKKVLWGTYFDGQFLGYAIAAIDGFAPVLGPLLPEAELARLLATIIRPGAGPFSVDAPLLLAFSNGVYLFELIVPLFLLYRPTRSLAVLASALLLIGIEAAARQFLFGLFFFNLLLLFLPSAGNRWFLPVFAVAYATLVVLQLFVLKEVVFN